MKFGSVPLDEAAGLRLGHSVRAGRRFPKGHLLMAADIEQLAAYGYERVVAVRLAPSDVDENEAAARLGKALASVGISAERASTGRCNIHAAGDGLLVVDSEVVDALNAIHPGITLATLPDQSAVRTGRMVATVKIIPFAVPDRAVDEAAALLEGTLSALGIRHFRKRSATMISTSVPGFKASIAAKTKAVTQRRLSALNCELVEHVTVSHDEEDLSAALRAASSDLIVVFGASAVADPEDVVPAAIRAAGGSVEFVGMPVDPGNLLCFGHLGDRTIIGAPGCARSPVENGFDWALRRVAADLPVTAEWARGLGVGGLLMEIESRPRPREVVGPTIVVLAAGRSSRMGEANKLLLELEGKPLLTHAVDTAIRANIGRVRVVTGHQHHEVEAALAYCDVEFVHNPDFGDGMSGSIRAGLDGVEGDAMIVLGDMPDVSSSDLVRLVETFLEMDGEKIVASCDPANGRRGNPVLWPARLLPELRSLEGDRGARDILEASEDEVVLVDIEGASRDLDTPAAFEQRAKR